MNIQLFRYAVEVARSGSISKAAEYLYMNQPNLSKAIKELEQDVGVTIFRRTTKGISSVTEEGRVFIEYAKSILSQLDDMREHLSALGGRRAALRAAVPRAGYIAQAFADFVAEIGGREGYSLSFQETGALRAITLVAEENYDFAIIRCRETGARHLLSLVREKGMESSEILAADSVILVSAASRSAQKARLTAADLSEMIEIVNDDFTLERNVESTLKGPSGGRRIYASERGSRYELLSRVENCYMWVSPTPKRVLERNGLTQRRCEMGGIAFKDFYIRRQGVLPGEMEKALLESIGRVKSEILGNEGNE